METTLKRPFINFRMIAFAGVMLLLIGAPVYVYVDSVVHGGIKQTSDGIEVDLKAMSVFDFDQVNGTINDIPKKWRDLDGKKIVCYGEIYSPREAGRYIDSFTLVYSIAKCCYGGPPQVQCAVESAAVPGAHLEYYSNLVRVKGTLHVGVTRDAGRVSGIYSLDVESIEPQ